jgi:hypothetical protein
LVPQARDINVAAMLDTHLAVWRDVSGIAWAGVGVFRKGPITAWSF